MGMFSIMKGDPNGYSGSDKLMILGAMLKDLGNPGGDSTLLKIQSGLQDRRKEALKLKAQEDFLSAFMPQTQVTPTPAMSVQRNPQLPQAAPIDTPMLSRLPQTQPVPSPGMNGPLPPPITVAPPPISGINDPKLLPLALRMGMAGVNVTPALDILKAQKPDVRIGPDGRPYDAGAPSSLSMRFRNPQAVNGTVVDLNNVENENRYVPDAPVKGAMPVYDNRGRVTDWKLPIGARTAIGQAQEATTLGSFRGGLQRLPNGDGTETVGLGADIYGGGRSTQSQAGAAFDQKTAEAEAARLQGLRDAVASDQKLGPIIGQIRGILDGGDIITGMGANERLQFERAAALAGDPKAQKRVKDTELYQNLTSRQVLPLVKQLGTGNSITDTDREFISKIVAGEIKLNKETMREVVNIYDRSSAFNRRQLEGFSAPVGSASSRPSYSQGVRTTLGRSRIVGVE